MRNRLPNALAVAKSRRIASGQDWDARLREVHAEIRTRASRFRRERRRHESETSLRVEFYNCRVFLEELLVAVSRAAERSTATASHETCCDAKGCSGSPI